MEKENCRELLNFNRKYENNVFLDHDLFDRFHDLNLNWRQTAYAFAYYYFHLWAYRYAKYQLADDSYLNNTFINKLFRQGDKIRAMSGLIKKGGILEQSRLLETTADFPVSWKYTDEDGLSLMMLEDLTEGDHTIKARMGVPHKYAVKRPVSGFQREKREGVYFDVSNTLHVEFEAFLYCLENEDIGVTGFYLYCFLAHLNFREGGSMVYKSPEGFSKSLNASSMTIRRLLLKMRDYNMVSCDVKDYVKTGDKSKRRPNGYIVNEYDEFFYRKTAKPIRGSFKNPKWKGEKKDGFGNVEFNNRG